MNYELMWKRFQKHILSVKKEHYTKKELLRMIEGFEYAECLAESRRKKEGEKRRYVKLADREGQHEHTI